MEAWATERIKVSIDEDQLISLIIQRKKAYLNKHAHGYDGVQDQGEGKYVCINEGRGSHYDYDTAGPEVSKEIYDNIALFEHMLRLLKLEQIEIGGFEHMQRLLKLERIRTGGETHE